jgi:hypothetical protein
MPINVVKTKKFSIFTIDGANESSKTKNSSNTSIKNKTNEPKESSSAKPKQKTEESKSNPNPKPAVAAPKSYVRRDHLRDVEKRIQACWKTSSLYDSNPIEGKEKYFINFPYPYMNGRLHIGHAFSFTKAEFTARFQRLLGSYVYLLHKPSYRMIV